MNNVCHSFMNSISIFKKLFDSKAKTSICDCCGTEQKCVNIKDLVSFIKGDLEKEYSDFNEIGTEEWEIRGDEIISSEDLLNEKYQGFECIDEKLKKLIYDELACKSWIIDLSKKN